MQVRYLTAYEVLAITEYYMRALGYAPPALRANGRNLLESAIMRAQTAAHYADADLIQQAVNGKLDHLPEGAGRAVYRIGTYF